MSAQRDRAAIAHEVRTLLDVIRQEREHYLASLESFTGTILSAVEADAREDNIERDAHCKCMLDFSHELLGDCDPVETLCALLGYEDPEPEL